MRAFLRPYCIGAGKRGWRLAHVLEYAFRRSEPLGTANKALIVALSSIGALGILLYETDGFSAFDVGALALPVVGLFACMWAYQRVVYHLGDKRIIGYAGLFSLLFSSFLVAGHALDGPSNLTPPCCSPCALWVCQSRSSRLRPFSCCS